ncbi:MAG: septum formation initiator family protein [Bernardetiaceae bacterium]|jgi:cell division protein FtsB|nr:septum formation initiator family protein [Bernardetiaceae bacterium]
MNTNLRKWAGKLNNFYVIFAASFLVWMAFFDSNNFYSQYLHRQKIEKLSQDAAFYEQGIGQLKAEQKAMRENPKLLEKFAREKYRMKRPGEDVYIIKSE